MTKRGTGRPRVFAAGKPAVLARLPEDLLARLDAHHEKLKKANPGMSLSRADVVRSLIHAGLDAVASK